MVEHAVWAVPSPLQVTHSSDGKISIATCDDGSSVEKCFYNSVESFLFQKRELSLPYKIPRGSVSVWEWEQQRSQAASHLVLIKLAGHIMRYSLLFEDQWNSSAVDHPVGGVYWHLIRWIEDKDKTKPWINESDRNMWAVACPNTNLHHFLEMLWEATLWLVNFMIKHFII